MESSVSSGIRLSLAFLAIAFVSFVTGCGVNLKKDPPVYWSLDASVRIGGKIFPVKYSWYHHHHLVWDEGSGVHPAWASSAFSVLRIVDANYAIAFRLPSGGPERELYFKPNLVLISRKDLTAIREYQSVVPGIDRDGFVTLIRYEIKGSPIAFESNPMTPEELALRHAIDEGNYCGLLVQSYSADQWARSSEVFEALKQLKEPTFLGKRSDPEGQSPYRLFGKFHGRSLLMDKNPPTIYGLVPASGVWGPTSGKNVITYLKNFGPDSNGTNPIEINYHGVRFDQREHDLFYDPKSEELMFVWPYGFSKLSKGEFGEGELP